MNKRTIFFMLAAMAAIFIAFVLITVLISKPSAQEKKPDLVYNYFPFYNEQGMWKTTLQRGPQKFELMLRYNPEEVEDIPYAGKLTPDFIQKPPVYITFDPDAPQEQMKYLALSAAEVGLSLVRGFGLEIEAACTKNLTEACANRSIINCGDNASVVYLKLADQPGTLMGERCITIQGKNWSIIKAVDRMLYEWYGVIQKDKTTQLIEQYKADVRMLENAT
ncbi:hypothetical protein KY329_01450 [Candidatus Woesearchaeota archaeon]|nr:hypothetical protein [Candidatus Woesearchaeota archaeon]